MFKKQAEHPKTIPYRQSTLRPEGITEGIIVPLITPFKNGTIDIAALKKLVIRMVQSGVHGLVACGTTAEAAHLSEAEQELVLNSILACVKPGYPVFMGISGSDTVNVVKKIQSFNRFAIAGYLVSAPYYVKPTQRGILLHFQAIAAASTHPIIIYNIPSRVGVNIELATLKKMASNPQFFGIKESAGDLHQLMDTVQQTPLAVYSGDDTMLLDTLCVGGIGAISAAAHIWLERYVDIYNLVKCGQMTQAKAIFDSMLPFIRLLFSEPNPAPVKAVLALQKLISEELRLPMVPVEMALKRELQMAFSKIDQAISRIEQSPIEPIHATLAEPALPKLPTLSMA